MSVAGVVVVDGTEDRSSMASLLVVASVAPAAVPDAPAVPVAPAGTGSGRLTRQTRTATSR